MTNPWFRRRTECPVCASEDFRKICQKPYDESPIEDYLEIFYQGQLEHEYLKGASYILCECEVCDAIFQRDIPGDALMERLYEKWLEPDMDFEHHQKRRELDTYARYVQEIMRLISYFGGQGSSLSFLDFGMGWGTWALLAKAFGVDSCGTELSEARAELARSNGIKVISWDEIPQYKFDFINTAEVFEHIAEPLQTLRHLKKALKPGGLLKVGVPQNSSFDIKLNNLGWETPGETTDLFYVAPLEHINFFRRKSIIMMASEAGMEEVFIPMKVQYSYTIDWSGARSVMKNVVRPLYLNWFKRFNRIFLRDVESF